MDATLREVISEKAGETAFDGFEKSTGALGASVKEVRDVIEMSGKTVFRDGRSHYKKTGIILGIALTVTFLAGNVLGASSSRSKIGRAHV